MSLTLAREGIRSPLERLGFEEACARMLTGRRDVCIPVFLKLLERAGGVVPLADLRGPYASLQSDPDGRVRKNVERLRCSLEDLGFGTLIQTRFGEGYMIDRVEASRWVRNVLECIGHLTAA